MGKQDLELQIDFSDITLAEADGNYKEAKEIMIKEFPHNEDWMLQSDVTISGSFGVGEMKVNFYGDKKILIVDYKPSIGDVFYNPDITGFSTWAQSRGWNIPHPHADLCRQNRDFWKHFWETLIIDSEYFDRIYGKREGVAGLEDYDE